MEETFITENGIPIYYYPNNNISGFSLSLYLRAGSMFEAPNERGGTHFFEHAVFRHLNKLYNGELYKLIDSSGLSFDASTGVKYAEFNISGAAKHFPLAARILTDIFIPFDLNDSDLRPEKGRIKAEMREEDNTSSLEHFCTKAVWENTTLSNTVSGNARELDRIGVKKLKLLQKKLLSAENLFFYVSGAVSPSDVQKLSERLAELSVSHTIPLTNTAPIPIKFGAREQQLHVKNANYSAVRICFDCKATSKDLPKLYLLWDMLFSGETSILHDQLSEKKGLIYSFDGYVDTYDNLSLFSLNYEVRSDKLYRSIEQALGAFASVSELAYTHLPYVLPAYTDNAPLLEDSPTAISSTFGYEAHILGQSYRSVYERSNAFNSVSAESIARLANETFRPENITLALKTNKSKLDSEKIYSSINILK